MQNTVKAPAQAPSGGITTKRRKIRSLDRVKARAGWFFVAPFVIGLVIIYIPIILNSIWFSFNSLQIQTGGGYVLYFVFFDNYRDALFTDPLFVQTLVSALQSLVFNIPAIVIFSLFMAVMLNNRIAGRAVFRAILFLPVIVSTGIIAQIDQQNFMAQYMQSGGIANGSSATDMTSTGGTVNPAQLQAQQNSFISIANVQWLFDNMMVGQGLVQYVVQVVNNVLNVVNQSGVQILIFLTGLQSISPQIYESAYMEGASAWETFWKITFPMISPMILVNAIYTVIDAFTQSTNPVMYYIQYTVQSEADGDVIGSAMSWMYFLLVLLIIGAVAGILSAYVFYQRREQ